MISNLLRKAKKAPWVLSQPLTNKPSDPLAVISDLFIWRDHQEWNTYFELLDLSSLFGDNDEHQVDIVFFDDNGNQFHQQSVELNGLHRQVLEISKLLSALDQLPCDYGTFSIFHQKVPDSVLSLESFIAERGYVSYQYKNTPLRSYVHGNLDAIDDSLMPLCGSSLLGRLYNLQYLLEPNKSYEIALTNASSVNKKTIFQVVDYNGIKQIEKCTTLKPKQVFVFSIEDLSIVSRLIIKSKMIMARPVVFCFNNDNMDVFHG
ncbi:hypothetical protein OAK82_02240 [Candidatus Thioglobus sp.]|nr:hypothetical protein [Candidatus Thioglobus sp.]